MSDEENESDGEETQQTDLKNLNYEEKDENQFYKIEKMILDEIQKRKSKSNKETEDEEEGEGEGEEFDPEAFIEEYNPFELTNEKELEEFKNRMQYVMQLGIYGGERDEDSNERDGKGHAIYANGDHYIGVFEENVKQGYGKYYYKHLKPEEIDSRIYSELEFADQETQELMKDKHFVEAAEIIQKQLKDKELNYSILRIRFVIENGPHPFYIGQFKKDMQHGKGIMKYQNGSFYRGEWFEGKAHGKGEMLYQNGDEYQGDWFEGLKHGEGIYKFKNLNVQYKGKWENGKFIQGSWEMVDGNNFHGFSSFPTFDGKFVFDDFSISGTFRNGKWYPENNFVKEK